MRNAGRSNHNEPDRRAFNLGGDSPQVLGRCTDLTAAEPDFDSEPCAVVPLDDDVDLIPALGVPVVEDSAGLSGLGVNTDVMHDLSLEEESQGLRICEQPIDSRAQKAGRERGVSEVARGGLGGRLLGPQARGPCGLVLDEEHPLGQVVKGGNGGRANSRRELLLHPASESREGSGLRLECGHSPQVGEKAARVAARPGEGGEVVLSDLLDVGPGSRLARRNRLVMPPRPPAGDNALDDVAKRRSRLDDVVKTARQERPQRDLAGGLPGLRQGHGPHHDGLEAPRAGVSERILVRCCRSGEDELAGPAAVINRAPHLVPQGWDELPLIEEARSRARQGRSRGLSGKGRAGRGKIESELRCRLPPSRLRLPGGARPLDDDRSGGGEGGAELAVHDTGNVGPHGSIIATSGVIH